VNTCGRLTLCLLFGFCWELLRFTVKQSDTAGVGSKGADVSDDLRLGPMLPNNRLAERVDFAEDVFVFLFMKYVIKS
jgi:hypothetical protein